MKICFLTHDLRSDYGAGVFSHRLISGIKERLGWDVVALTAEASGHPIELAILHPQKIKLVREFWYIRNIIKTCDIVHALDGFPYGIIAVLASLGFKKKIIITAVGSGAIIPLYSRLYAPLMRWCYRRADMVTAISAFTRSEILKKVPDLLIRVINHGVDIKQFENTKIFPIEYKYCELRNSPCCHPRFRGNDRREEKSFVIQSKHYQPYILSVGTIRWRKGYHFSIRAFARVAKEFPDFHYVIVGKHYKDDYSLRLKRLIKELGLGTKVHILEHIDSREALARIYKGAELFCLFSQNMNHDVEGFGLVFLEAAAAGLPVVGAKNCGVDDAVREGKNGLLVDTRDPQDFAHAILMILRDKELQQRMRMVSLTFARGCTWEKRIEEYIDIYHKVI